MYKVIVVDDEIQSREILASYISEYSVDFEISGVFNSGEKAVQYLSENDVDIVFSDIKMPNIDGITLSKWIYENRPSIKVVLVSAFAEFEYARLAMSYNVIYYLLKAIDEKELKEVLYNIKDVLDREQIDRENSFRDELEESFYEQLCGGGSVEAYLETVRRAKKCGFKTFDFNCGNYVGQKNTYYTDVN